MRSVLLVLMCAACGHLGFDEAAPLEPPAHVPDTTPLGGAGTLVLGDAVIDTTALTIDGAPPARGQLVAVVQQGAVAELALLQADHIVVTGTVTVRGVRGLVLLARTIDVSGTLDGGGRGATPGPGAAAAKGEAGNHPAGDVCDSGGGGGGHATAGAAGGNGAACTGGTGGGALGDAAVTLLIGGGGGGDGVTAACGVPAGGGGGGALQLSAQERVRISGAVIAGGGGGTGGLECGDGDAGSGGGGGAGGAIYIEAATVDITGAVAAFGGGGGGGGNGSEGNGAIGKGSDGVDGTTTAGAGGAPAAPNGGIGGAGGTDTAPPGFGQSAQHNAGGGGGAAGRIVIVTL